MHRRTFVAGLGAALATDLRAAGHPVVSVRPGDRFAWLSPEAALTEIEPL